MLPNTVFISSENEVIRPPEAREQGTAAYTNYVPAYNCSVVSNAPTRGVRNCAISSKDQLDLLIYQFVSHQWVRL